MEIKHIKHIKHPDDNDAEWVVEKYISICSPKEQPTSQRFLLGLDDFMYSSLEHTNNLYLLSTHYVPDFTGLRSFCFHNNPMDQVSFLPLIYRHRRLTHCPAQSAWSERPSRCVWFQRRCSKPSPLKVWSTTGHTWICTYWDLSERQDPRTSPKPTESESAF